MKYELPPGAENERKIKHYTDMLNMTCQYETWWAEREEFCNEAERKDDVETHNILQQMRYDGCALSEISKFIAGRTEAQPLQRQQYYEQLTYNINNLKNQSLNYYLTVVMKIR